ncbi:TMV resistance protein N-like isoform X3 [Cucumis melo]|nr:TMV resistance protein N-like isoform X3 [Cucumis melo]
MKRNIDIPNADGATLIKRRISNIKALIILDDVDHLSQLQQLAGSSDWFGSGSRIIVTTRNEHLLVSHGIEKRYKVEGLNVEEALQLFSQKAFGTNYPKKDYFDLSIQVVEYSGDLPLAIEVLGSSLRDKSREVWKNAVEKLKEIRDKKILEILRVSYDLLDKSEKEIFLDLACFFKKKSKKQAIEVLQSFGFQAIIGLEILEERSLITTPHEKIQMHDLIQEMGQEVVRRMFPNNPEKRTRLWLREDVNLALSHDQGAEAIEGIVMDSSEEGESHLNAKVFSTMTNLRILKINNVSLCGELDYLSDQLRFLSWHGYPSKYLPPNFHPKSILELELPNSFIHYLWKGSKRLDRLKTVNLSDSQFISKTPDFSGVPNLERLILSGCVRLTKLHQSLGSLKRLIQLDLKNCKALKAIPFSISLESLIVLSLSNCSSLKNFPNIVGNMKNLTELHLDGTSIQELHPSIGHLTGLVLLNLENCTNLLELPNTIGSLICLKTLTLHGCSKLTRIPESLGFIASLEKLDVTNTCINQAPLSLQLLTNLEILDCRGLSRKFIHSLFPSWNSSSYSSQLGLKFTYCLSSFCSMKKLNLSDCSLKDGDIPDNLQSLPSLEILDLSGNSFSFLPKSVEHLVNLRTLYLVNCKRLQELPKLPLSVRSVEARDCVSLKEYYNQEKQMPSSSTGMAVISCPITDEEHNFKIDRVNLSSIHLRTMVQRYIEVLTWQQEEYFFTIPYTQLISCFDHRKLGSSITVHCHQNTYESRDNERIGIALSAFFQVQENPQNIGHSETTFCNFIINLETDDCPLKSPLIFNKNEDKLRPPRGLLVFFIPFRIISYWLDQSCCVDISIIPTNPMVKVKACGVSLLFQQNGGVFIGKIMKGLFGSPDFAHKFMLEHILNQQNHVDVSSLVEGGPNARSYWLNALHRTVGVLPPKLQPSIQSNDIEDGSSSNLAIEQVSTQNDHPTIMLKRNLKSVLRRIFEELKLNGEYYCFPRGEISKRWFTLQVKRPSVTIKVPPNLHKNKKWMGLAFFAIFASDINSNISQSFSYQLEFDEYPLGRPSIIRLHDGAFSNDSRQLWVSFEPREVYPYRLNKWRNLRVSFLPSCSQTKVILCGARLLYQEDLDEFVDTIIDSVLGCSINLHEFYDGVFLNSMLSLIRSQKYDPDIEEDEDKDEALMETRGGNYASTSSSSLESTTKGRLDDSNDYYYDLKQCLHVFFQRSLQNRYDTAFDFIVRGHDVPQLFSRQPERNRASIELPPTLYTSNVWIGFVVCTLLYVNKNPTAIYNNLGSRMPHDLMCQFEIEQGLLKPLHIHTTMENKWLWLDERQFVWLYYTPRRTFGHILRHCSYIRAIVEADSPELTVRRCGIYLLHNQDREKIDQILIESLPTRST